MTLPYCMVCQTHHGFLDQLCPALNPRGDNMRNDHAVTIDRNDTSTRTLSLEGGKEHKDPYVKIVRENGELNALYVKDVSFSVSQNVGEHPDEKREAERLRDRAHLLMRAADLLEDDNG